VTTLRSGWLGNCGSIPERGKRLPFSPQPPDWLQFNVYHGILPWRQSDRDVKPTTDLHNFNFDVFRIGSDSYLCTSESIFHLYTWLSSCTLHYFQSSQAIREHTRKQWKECILRPTNSKSTGTDGAEDRNECRGQTAKRSTHQKEQWISWFWSAQ